MSERMQDTVGRAYDFKGAALDCCMGAFFTGMLLASAFFAKEPALGRFMQVMVAIILAQRAYYGYCRILRYARYAHERSEDLAKMYDDLAGSVDRHIKAFLP